MKVFIIIFVFIYSWTSSGQASDFEHIDFTKAENIVKLNKGKSLDNLPLLAHELTSKLETDVEKFRAIYRWVCENISGDYKQHNKVSKKLVDLKNDSLGYIKWNDEFKKEAFKTLLKDKKTMCTGYAYLIKELCFIANIECKIIEGYARSFETNVEKLEYVNHSWNVVKLNNKWYLSDATWSSGYMLNGYFFIKDYNDGYFLTEPILFAKNHFPVHEKWFLNDSLIKNKFEAEPIVYGETFKHQIIPKTPKKLYTSIPKNEEVVFTFQSLEKIEDKDISLVQVLEKEQKAFKIYNLKNENGKVSFKYIFKHRGTYDVHLKIKSDIVASYSIKVLKNKTLH
ncbi:transglutaminase domain-containing protein [Winogradskyella sp. SYSU M77433]|uniref:transglutaminase domain-containing protein n=1 Tax=Winogradskyella sp. SYSU M77433 TaxID=3042722 RepID=UPI00248082C2|nr:transglutaminase domain-containing protein [Winogradskyella sp. SYSU M77433]MDH7913098.1 transglutaminase domain-containing protein [Winogradskyella sp. SYSU M77433]